MMTREEKIEWARTATTEQLLKQYEASTVHAADPLKWAEIYRVDVHVFDENYDIVRAEVVRRLSKNN